ncbi:hypothetical protein SLEP1_g8492 [Rubroshorea leprosula]|uniref:Uncharacterized protein n=1 Tax=Rubroshorea leprosula TaxID=152421 RepID=A0AAV5I9S6_9ROSI|nr:hypothetical protein SLEP1_g8492 [Rubroshorea leprosula]
MVLSGRFTSFAVAFTLVLLVTDSFALTHQVLKNLDGNISLKAAGKNSADIAKEAYDHGVPAVTAEDGNMRFAGRKIMLRSSNLEKKSVKTGNLDAKEARISGAALSVGNCNNRDKGNLNVTRCESAVRNRRSLHHHMKVKMTGYGNADKQPESSVEHSEYQTVNHELPTNSQLCSTYFKSADPDNGGSECLAVSEKSGLHQEFDNVPFQKLESEKLLEATYEVVKLMNKDYQGAEGPQHKPPINNNQPLDQEP